MNLCPSATSVDGKPASAPLMITADWRAPPGAELPYRPLRNLLHHDHQQLFLVEVELLRRGKATTAADIAAEAKLVLRTRQLRESLVATLETAARRPMPPPS
jgi:hypothetical protein